MEPVEAGATDDERERALVARLARRDRRALHSLYELHGARVQRLCRRLLGRAADAEDAAQDVFLKLFERAERFDGRARFTTWLHRFTVNLCLHRRERERLRAAASLPRDGDELHGADEPPEEALARTETRAGLERLLARLSDEHRTIVVLRELEVLSYREIGEVLELPQGTVMSRLARAREQLLRLAQRSPLADVADARDEPRPTPLTRRP